MREDKHDTEPNILKKFAYLLGTEINNGKLEIPEKFGAGYCIGYVFNENIRILILNYELNEHLIIENPDLNITRKTILFKFQNIFLKRETLPVGGQLKATLAPSVLIATRSVNTELLIPIHTNTATINIEVDANYLSGLFDLSEKSPVLNSLLKNAQSLLFEQMIYPSLQKIVDEILAEPIEETFKLFFLRVKTEELVCRLLIELEKRDTKQLYPLNSQDIQTIYQVKEKILEHLETPPVIKDLAIFAGMSPTKLKRLFKQIFGDSIFSYYQKFRMEAASHLLKQHNQSVSDVGYKLGFTNLSHFSKTFRAHFGIKPKQYSQS